MLIRHFYFLIKFEYNKVYRIYIYINKLIDVFSINDYIYKSQQILTQCYKTRNIIIHTIK